MVSIFYALITNLYVLRPFASRTMLFLRGGAGDVVEYFESYFFKTDLSYLLSLVFVSLSLVFVHVLFSYFHLLFLLVLELMLS